MSLFASSDPSQPHALLPSCNTVWPFLQQFWKSCSVIFHSDSTVLSICWHVLISGGFFLDYLNCWYLLCTPLIFLPFLLCLLTLVDPYAYLKETLTACLANRRTIYVASFWTWCKSVWPSQCSLFAGAILLLSPRPGCPMGCLPLPRPTGTSRALRPSLAPIRSCPYLDFEHNLTLELLVTENDRLSVTENLEERLSKMCPQCQLAARQESLHGRGSLSEKPEPLQWFLSRPKNLPRKSCIHSSQWQPCPGFTAYDCAGLFLHFLHNDCLSFFPPTGKSKLYLRETETRGAPSTSFLS